MASSSGKGKCPNSHQLQRARTRDAPSQAVSGMAAPCTSGAGGAEMPEPGSSFGGAGRCGVSSLAGALSGAPSGGETRCELRNGLPAFEQDWLSDCVELGSKSSSRQRWRCRTRATTIPVAIASVVRLL